MTAVRANLLVFNLATDADSPVHGFTTVWLNTLAREYAAVDVVTMTAGRDATAANVTVYSVGREHGYSEPHRLARFYGILGGLLRRRRYAACFAHMNTLFAILGAPLLRLYRVPVTLWYAHSAVSPRLWLAEKLVDHVVTASPESFRLPSRKVTVIGHGIDTDAFTPPAQPPAPGQPFTILSLSRIAPVKHIEECIEAARLLAHMDSMPSFRLRIVGGAAPEHAAYQQSLLEQAAASDLGQRVEFAGPTAYDQIVPHLHAAHVLVNTSRTHSIDKAVLEAMACGLPVVTSNEAFRPILRPWAGLLLCPPGSPSALADRLARLAALPPVERAALGDQLRAIVVRDHSLEGLARRLVTDFLRG